jgi:hypothetical protein
MRKLHFKVYRQLLTIGRVDVVLFQSGARQDEGLSPRRSNYGQGDRHE